MPLPAAAVILARTPDSECPALRVWPFVDMLMIFRFSTAEEIDFDVDLREIQGQERLDKFCRFLRSVGRQLGKPVLMGDENGRPAEDPVLGFFVATDRVAVIGPSPRRDRRRSASEAEQGDRP